MNTGVVALLELAATLLAMLGTGNVDDALRAQAVDIAQQAIQQASISLQAPATPDELAEPLPSTLVALPAVRISDVLAVTGATTTQVRWTTSEPVDARLVLSNASGTTQTKASVMGTSTFHVVDFDGLTEATDYSFVIEVGSGKNVQREKGIVRTTGGR